MLRMLFPSSIAIVGLSDDPTKHGGRVLANLRKLGYPGKVVGVNPRLPEVAGVEVRARLSDLDESPDLVVCAVPASVIPDVVSEAEGAGGVVVFAGGFAEAGADGAELQSRLRSAASAAGVRVLGPNSGGIIHPGARVAASFLTCLDRPAEQIRPGPVGLVTQSGGTGSYVHNLAAAAGSGLAVSISTGNEADLGIADGISALLEIPDVQAIAVVLETVRDGAAFIGALEAARDREVPVVVCRVGTSRRGAQLMGTHTGALAVPAKVLEGVLEAFGAVSAETPEEMLAVAEVLARSPRPRGPRAGIVTHSGGVAILLTDLAERVGVALPHPGAELQSELEPLLQHGSSDNPLDMGGIIGGPGRFAEVVDRFAESGDFDCVVAVSTAHPPAHTVERVESLVALQPSVPVVHLWMAGDVGEAGLEMLRRAGAPVATEPRAMMRAVAALTRQFEAAPVDPKEPVVLEPVSTEHAAKAVLASWGLPVVDGVLAGSAEAAAEAAGRMDSPVVMKLSSPGVFHKTELCGVLVGIEGPEAARQAYERMAEAVTSRRPDAWTGRVLVERMASGPEVIVGLLRDPVFGPTVMVGLGGVAAEALATERFAPAPLAVSGAARLLSGVRGLELVLRRAGGGDEALASLAEVVADMSTWFVASNLHELEVNPVAWAEGRWQILDAVMVSGTEEGDRDGTTR